MIKMQLHQIAAVVNGRLVGKDARIQGVSTDSRSIQPGQLFVALVGVNFDGAEFCQQAISQGAAAVLVNRPVEVSVPQIICEDSQFALGHLASAWLQQCGPKVIAITGSNGKTTVKNMLYSVLRQVGQTEATRGNYNNEIGVPLTILALKPETAYLILEMGAAEPGDIRYLTTIAKPDVALVTNVSAAHIGRFGNLETIAESKAEIYQALDADGIAVINRDDSHAPQWLESTDNKVGFGEALESDYRLVLNKTDSKASVELPDGEKLTLKLPVLGKHNLLNAAAVVAIADQLNVAKDQIEHGLRHFKPESGRLQQHDLPQGGILIDDSYNANPASMQAAIKVLAGLPKPQLLVCGDMLELGELAASAHYELGLFAQQQGIDQLLVVGEWSNQVCLGFGSKACQAFAQIETLLQNIEDYKLSVGSILVKASRGMRLERVVKVLTAGEAA